MATPADTGAQQQQRSEKDKMLAGELYYAFDEQLLQERQAAKELLHTYNHELATKLEGRAKLLGRLLGSVDAADPPFFEPPFRCDYGYNIHVGPGSYANFGCVILDATRVTIGARVLLGPNVQLYTATHPLDGHVRNGCNGPEYGSPITIGDDCWLGGCVVVCPGVTIGRGAVVGAGSVVTRDVEEFTVVAGNPAKLLRRLERPPAATDGGGGAQPAAAN